MKTTKLFLQIDRPGSAPMEMTVNGKKVFSIVAGVGYSPSLHHIGHRSYDQAIEKYLFVASIS